HGPAAPCTGPGRCGWAGGVVGPRFAAQGNILVGQATVTALAETFQNASGALWHRLVEALAAGQRAGGDSRGKQSAALLVVREGGGYSGFNDRMIELGGDENPETIDERRRMLALDGVLFLRPRP